MTVIEISLHIDCKRRRITEKQARQIAGSDFPRILRRLSSPNADHQSSGGLARAANNVMLARSQKRFELWGDQKDIDTLLRRVAAGEENLLQHHEDQRRLKRKNKMKASAARVEKQQRKHMWDDD